MDINEELEKLKIQYNAADCVCRDYQNIEYLKVYKDMQLLKNYDKNKIIHMIKNNAVSHLEIIFDNNEIFISKVGNTHSCYVMVNKYIFVYSYKLNLKDTLIKTIINHNFIKNNDLYEIIKNKIYILKLYFIDIIDIYKYTLSIINDIYLNDNDIVLELFFSQELNCKA